MAEQAFLTRHYDDNAKKPDRDPRGAFRTPGDAPAGVVGPLGPASFSLPAVERALADMDGGAPAPAPPALERKRTATAGRASLAAGPPRPGSAAGAGAPASPEPKTPASSQTQHEVLHNFFQSLLSKDRAGATAAVAKGAQAKSPSKSDATDAVE
jgi:dynein light intermediate chain 1